MSERDNSEAEVLEINFPPDLWKWVWTLHVILLIKIILFLLINLLWFSLLQVQKIDIGYAKTAKKMDVKKLKGAMWGLLADKGESDKVGWLITLTDCWQSSYHKVRFSFS